MNEEAGEEYAAERNSRAARLNRRSHSNAIGSKLSLRGMKCVYLLLYYVWYTRDCLQSITNRGLAPSHAAPSCASRSSFRVIGGSFGIICGCEEGAQNPMTHRHHFSIISRLSRHLGPSIASTKQYKVYHMSLRCINCSSMRWILRFPAPITTSGEVVQQRFQRQNVLPRDRDLSHHANHNDDCLL